MHIPFDSIIFVGGVHGSEPLPLVGLKLAGVAHLVGNPKALEKHTRYVDRDLNRAFENTHGSDYESGRARYLLEKASPNNFVIDLHTASHVMVPFCVVTDKSMSVLAAMAGIEHVVYFPRTTNFISGSLIHVRRGMVIECGSHVDSEVPKRIVSWIEHLKKGKILVKPKIFEVFDVIAESGEYEDFVSTGDFYPVFSHTKSHPGYKARLVT